MTPKRSVFGSAGTSDVVGFVVGHIACEGAGTEEGTHREVTRRPTVGRITVKVFICCSFSCFLTTLSIIKSVRRNRLRRFDHVDYMCSENNSNLSHLARILEFKA